jgi:hypothetical protein
MVLPLPCSRPAGGHNHGIFGSPYLRPAEGHNHGILALPAMFNAC